MTDTFYTISAKDSDNGDATELVKHVADKVDGVTVKFKEGGHIRLTGDAKIVISDGEISL
jgi:translation elongation factor P/translation initiation factor 5A